MESTASLNFSGSFDRSIGSKVEVMIGLIGKKKVKVASSNFDIIRLKMTSKLACKPAQRPKNKVKSQFQTQTENANSDLQTETSTRARIRHAAAQTTKTRPDAGVKPKTLWNSWMSESERAGCVGLLNGDWSRTLTRRSRRESKKIRDSGTGMENFIHVSSFPHPRFK